MIEKLKYLVVEILKKNNDLVSVNIIQNSGLEVLNKGNTRGNMIYSNHFFYLIFTLNPALYVNHVDELDRISDVIKHYFNKVTDKKKVAIEKVVFKPDYNKIVILNSNISVIETPWEEINTLQEKIIEDMKSADSPTDFQNIGNSARTIMDKLARLVFDPKTHIAPENVDVRNGKFKNQLHTYIDSVLSGKANKELRLFSTSAIDFTEKSIDLMNKTTHKLDVKKHFGEACVISTINVISLLKAINEL
ncbi:hypothetical protein [uncultured Psychroserpens sp.]|uniref:hypothetical protein n=1 Tax=uncultured Psychroserpens sp. TaxID=255436 RepID=UPI002630557F|nr:hypothetical protein [uncultured Psychroserpens sp.]